MIFSKSERKIVADALRDNANEGADFDRESIESCMPVSGDDAESYRVLADLIDPDNIPDNIRDNADKIRRSESEEITRWVIENGGLAGVKATGAVLADVLTLVFGADHGSVKHDELMRELRARLMPEGMEWPRFEDGEPVRIGDEFVEQIYGNLCMVGHFAINENAFLIYDEEDSNDYESIDHGTHRRVKRQAPKVLDADGVEIRIGDTVYLLTGDWCDKFPCYGFHGGEELKVYSLNAEHVEGGIGCKDVKRFSCFPQPSQLTHRAPVLAADGRPLHEGEHVYHVDTGAELVVKELPKPGEYQAVVVFATPASHLTSFDPNRLTHERPVADSWKRIFDDVLKNSCDYFGHGESSCNGCPAYDWNVGRGGDGCSKAKELEIVRRAKALSEKGM